jgi:hypothetical protein
MGGFSSNTFSRIVNYDANGWLGLIGGPLEYLENIIKTIREKAGKANKDPKRFKTILLTYPNITNSNQSNEARFPLTGAIDEIGNDIRNNFLPIGRDVDNMINITKQLSKFAS